MGVNGLNTTVSKVFMGRPPNDMKKQDKTIRIPRYMWTWSDKRIDEGIFRSYAHVVEVAVRRLMNEVYRERPDKYD
jgi:hypothetical protein